MSSASSVHYPNGRSAAALQYRAYLIKRNMTIFTRSKQLARASAVCLSCTGIPDTCSEELKKSRRTATASELRRTIARTRRWDHNRLARLYFGSTRWGLPSWQ